MLLLINERSTQTFINEYGSKSFEEFPFCDGDAFLMCEIFYMPFESVVPSSFRDVPINFADAADWLFSARGRKHKGNGIIMFSKQPSKNMNRVAASKRYDGMKITAVRKFFSKKPAVQFCAGTFLMPDGTVLINYRGTDDTIAGWKEDVDIFLTRGTPSHPMAVSYLEEAAVKYDGDIRIIGHSKGGNIAQYAALNCSEETRARIISLYNCDGPGFYNHDFIQTKAYKDLYPVYHHFVPRTTFVGMCMAHDYDYNVVKTFFPIPGLSHYIGIWELKDGKAVCERDVSLFSKMFDVWVADLVGTVEHSNYCDGVEEVFDQVSRGVGEDTLTDFAKHPHKAVKGGYEAWKTVDPEAKEKLKDSFEGGMHNLVDTVVNIKDIDPKERTQKAFAGEPHKVDKQKREIVKERLDKEFVEQKDKAKKEFAEQKERLDKTIEEQKIKIAEKQAEKKVIDEKKAEAKKVIKEAKSAEKAKVAEAKQAVKEVKATQKKKVADEKKAVKEKKTATKAPAEKTE